MKFILHMLTKATCLALLLLTGFFTAESQTCTDLITDGDFASFTGTYNTNEFCTGQVPAWEPSHGSPQIGGNSPHSYPYYAYLWGAVTTGEGIMTNATIVSGRKYVLTYWYRKMTYSTPLPDVDHLYVQLAPSSYTSICTWSPMPSFSPSQTIDHITNISTTSWTMSQVCFTATDNFAKVMIYPMSNDQSYPVWVDIDDVSIVELKADAGTDQSIACCATANIGPACTIPGATYSWSPTTGLSNPSIANPVASPSVTTTYTLTVTGPNGCTATDQTVITLPHNCPKFFNHVYGTLNNDVATDGGLALPSTMPGNIMVGLTDYRDGKIIVTRTDAEGDFTTPFHYNNFYSFARSAQNFDLAYLRSAKMAFRQNGVGSVIVMGDFVEPATTGPRSEIYFVEIDQWGTPTNMHGFMHPTNYLYLGNVKLSANGNFAYATGYAQNPVNGVKQLFVLKFNILSGSLMWSGLYNIANSGFITDEQGWDLIESPFNSNDLFVVGSVTDHNNPAEEDAFILRLNAASGATAGPVNIYSSMGSNTIDRFTTIEATTGQPGFIIGGEAQGNDMDLWAFKTDPIGTMLWSMVHNYNATSTATPQNEYNAGIKERRTSTGGVEFYQAGTTNNGNGGGDDMIVYKLDGGGAPIAQFTYGNANSGTCAALDIIPGSTSADGLMIYGTYNGLPGLGNNDFSMVKSFFNGYTSCNFDLSTPTNINHPFNNRNTTAAKLMNLDSSVFHCHEDTPVVDMEICAVSCISGGSNNLVAPQNKDNRKGAVIASPNPMAEGSPEVNVIFETETAETVNVKIYDMLGREYYNSTFALQGGTNTLPLDVSKANMAQGMYSVVITGNTIHQSTILIVK